MIKRIIGIIRQNNFLGNVTVLMSGSVISQLIPVIFSPVLSRIFGESDFGIYALFVSTINITGQLVCLKYDMAISVANDEQDAISLVYICIFISSIFSLILVGLFPFSEKISDILGVKNYIWIYLLPISTFLTGIYNAITNFNIRLSNYKDISSGNIIKSAVMIASQILFYFLGFGGISLIMGQIIAYFFGNMRLIKNIIKQLKTKNKLNFKRNFINNKNFPMYTMAGSLANSMVYNMTSFSLAYFYSSAELGYYSLINRVLAVPLMIISTSVGQVFLRESGENIREGKELTVFGNVTKVLFLVSMPLFLFLFIFANPIITFIFGENWENAASYMKIMIPLFMVRFIVTPISTTAIVIGKQKYTMLWQIGLLICSFLPMICALLFDISIKKYLMIFSGSLSIGYIAFYLLCNKLINDREKYIE